MEEKALHILSLARVKFRIRQVGCAFFLIMSSLHHHKFVYIGEQRSRDQAEVEAAAESTKKKGHHWMFPCCAVLQSQQVSARTQRT